MSDAAFMKAARRIVDVHASDGIEVVERDELARRIWNFAMALSPLERWMLFVYCFKEFSFREMGKREHLKRKDVELIFDGACEKLKWMLEHFGTQEV